MQIVYFDDIPISHARVLEGWVMFEDRLESVMDIWDYEVTVAHFGKQVKTEHIDIMSEVIDHLNMHGFYAESIKDSDYGR